MVTAVCYLAECFTFGKEPNIENMEIEWQRQHIVDVFLSILNFN